MTPIELSHTGYRPTNPGDSYQRLSSGTEMVILNHNAFPQVLIARPNGTMVNVIIGVQPGGTNKPAEFTLDQLVAVMQQLDGPGIDL